MQIAHVNAHGLTQIAEALAEHHKLGRDHFTDAMLRAWAAEAEDHFMNGNGCHFEIKPWDRLSSRPVVVDIDPAGFDVQEAAVE